MSAEQRPADRHPSAVEQPRPNGVLAFESELPLVDADTDTGRSARALSDRIERTRLRTKVAALERELEASEHRRRAVVDQYERILDERRAAPVREETSADVGPVERLRRLLR